MHLIIAVLRFPAV